MCIYVSRGPQIALLDLNVPKIKQNENKLLWVFLFLYKLNLEGLVYIGHEK